MDSLRSPLRYEGGGGAERRRLLFLKKARIFVSVMILAAVLFLGGVAVANMGRRSERRAELSPSGGTVSAEAPAPVEPTPAPPTEPSPLPEPVSEPEPSPEPEPEPPLDVTIAFGGDVLPSGRIGEKIKAGEYFDILDEELTERLFTADATIVNLESSVSERGSPIPEKAYTFRSPPENLAYLRDILGVDCVSLANNHTFDYGTDAFYDSLEYARAYGLTPIGAGNNVKEAAAPYIFDNGRVRVAVFAANQILSYTSWTSTDTRGGQLIAREAAALGTLGSEIKKARETCDYIIAYFHWGIELDRLPSERQRAMSHALIDAGVDVVIGAHPHVVQRFELYKGKPVVYSLGNFLFNSLNPETLVVFIHITDSGVRVECVPCVINGTLTKKADPEKADRLLRYWESLSPGVVFSAGGYMEQAPQATGTSIN
jgi:poly-gamma-glutamate synthesis protein (capsule biosynthesis protein)